MNKSTQFFIEGQIIAKHWAILREEVTIGLLAAHLFMSAEYEVEVTAISEKGDGIARIQGTERLDRRQHQN